jgi:hypothetical protein
VGFLYRLRERMQQVGFLPSDPLYKRVCTAYESLQGPELSTRQLGGGEA